VRVQQNMYDITPRVPTVPRCHSIYRNKGKHKFTIPSTDTKKHERRKLNYTAG